MTVRELIDELETYDSDAIVVIRHIDLYPSTSPQSELTWSKINYEIETTRKVLYLDLEKEFRFIY